MKTKKNNMKKAFVFDFDDTLATTDCCVRILDANSAVIRRITPAEFNTATLDAGQSFDFSEFRTLENVIALETFQLLSEVHGEGHDVVILSARPSEAADHIASWLQSHNVNATAVHCVGGKPIDIAKEKAKILTMLIQSFDVVWFFDDDAKNIEAATEVGCEARLV